MRKTFKKLGIIFMCSIIMCMFTGCGEAYKKGDINVTIDDNGKGYIEQEFELPKAYFDSELCKIKNEEEFIDIIISEIAMSDGSVADEGLANAVNDDGELECTNENGDNSENNEEINNKVINEELGITVEFDNTDDLYLKIKLKLDYDSFADFNKKIGYIVDEINNMKTSAKIYDSTYGIWFKKPEVIIGKIMEERLDQLGVSCDSNSYKFKYMIARMMGNEDEVYDENGEPGENLTDIENEDYIRDFRYINEYHFDNYIYNKEDFYVKTQGYIGFSSMATNILDCYLVDIVVANFDSIVNVDELNNGIKNMLLGQFRAYFDRRFTVDEFKGIIEKNNIKDISTLTLQEMDSYFGMLLLSEVLNMYYDIATDSYVFLPTKELFGIEPFANENKVILNKKNVTPSNEDYYVDNSKLVLGKTEYIKASVVKSTAIKLTWKVVEGATGYKVYVKENDKWKVLKSFTSKNAYLVTDLAPGKKYTFAIKAYKEDIAAETFQKQVLQTAPGKTTVIKIGRGYTSLKLTWSAVAGATGYRVYQEKDGKWIQVQKAQKGKTFTKKGLKENKSYKFAVRAYRIENGKVIWADSYKSVLGKTVEKK